MKSLALSAVAASARTKQPTAPHPTLTRLSLSKLQSEAKPLSLPPRSLSSLFPGTPPPAMTDGLWRSFVLLLCSAAAGGGGGGGGAPSAFQGGKEGPVGCRTEPRLLPPSRLLSYSYPFRRENLLLLGHAATSQRRGPSGLFYST